MNASTQMLFADGATIFGNDGDHATMLGIILSANRSQVVHCAAQFNFADHLADGPRTAGEIASAEGLSEDATFRLMRACTSYGLMTCDEHGRFSATPLIDTLRSDDPASMRSIAMAFLGPGFWLPYGHLNKAIRDDTAQAQATLGSDFWTYYATPGAAPELKAFTQMMGAWSEAFAVEIAKLLSIRGNGPVLDVGGASGNLVQTIMRANPELRGAVIDLAHVVPVAMAAAEAQGLQDRFEVHAGDFLAEVPAAALYLLKFILHDWPDEQCLMILRNCRRAAVPGARLIVAEVVLDGSTPTPFSAMLDITMMVLVGSRERTFDEYAALLGASGFRAIGITPTATPFSFIEAVAV